MIKFHTLIGRKAEGVMSTTVRSILITGASGFIGGVTAEAAMRRGLQVRTLSRRDWSGPPWVPAAGRFLGALPFNIPPAALRGVEALVHLAGTTGGENEQTARLVNVEGTRRLLALAREAGVGKVVYISSQSAREDAVSAYGRTKLEAEAVVRGAGLPWTILRPGLVYGAGDSDLYSRMAGVVRRFPVIPVLGSGRAAVQPIHAEDLAEAILRCLEPDAYTGETLLLGRPRPITLRGFLRAVAVAQRGRPKPMLLIPLRPIIAVVETLEKTGLSLPVNSNNLKGLEKVQPMPTADSLRRLGLTLRPLAEGLRAVEQQRHGRDGRNGSGRPAPPQPLDRRAVRVALVGAGRIGMFHALTLERWRGMRLTALVDANPKAPRFLRGIGVRAPAYRSIHEALEDQPLDAVIIATPPRFHLPLTAEAAGAGLGVFVEKPMARRTDELDAFERHGAGRATATGYYAPCLLHFQEALRRLRDGEFGRVEGFDAFCLQSYFPPESRWETRPELSGGGALINTASHALSMIHAAFGAPQAMRAQQRRVSSSAVEDAIAVEFQYPQFSGRLFGSWAIRGFPQLENRLVVWTRRGALVCNNTVAVFLPREGGAEWIGHQMDFDRAFNLAPDYIGGGVSEELRQFEARVRGGAEPVMNFERAAALERLLMRIYEQAPMLDAFDLNTGTARDWARHSADLFEGDAPPGASRPTPLILDVRGLDRLPPAFVRRLAGRWDGVQARAAQAGALLAGGFPAERICIVAPDFLNYARVQNSRGARGLLQALGPVPGAAFLRAALAGAAAGGGLTMWAGAQALLEADLARLPRNFTGEVVVFNFLTDMAVAMRRTSVLNRMMRAMSRLRRARVGFQTNSTAAMLEMLVYLDSPPDALHFLSSPSCPALDEAVALLRSVERFQGVRLTAEAGQLPGPVWAAVTARPAPWLHGAGALVVDALADPVLARMRRRRFAGAWRETFPGLPVPAAAL
ncbi:MAG: hypothetical protein Kow0059_22330 [Candidatus Sumerlaeia bacterium]